MAIEYICSCGRALHAPERAIGHMARCPACGAISPVPPVSVAHAAAGVAAAVEGAGAGEEPETIRAGFGGAARRAPAARKARPPLTRPVAGPLTLDEDEGGTWRYYVYLVLVLAMIPLLVWPFRASPKLDWSRRVIATYQAHAEQPGVQAKREAAASQMAKDPEFGNLDFLPFLPNGRIDSAIFPHDSILPWLFWPLTAAGVTVALVALAPLMGSGRSTAVGLVLASTVCGLVMLLILHAMMGADDVPWSWIGWLLDFSYTTGMERDVPLMWAILAFAVFCGLLMEALKAGLLLVGLFDVRNGPSWRQVLLRGLAIGAGMGAAEGTLYATWFYNGVEGGDAYLVRLGSVVALQAVWTGSAGLTLFNQRHYLGELEGKRFFGMFLAFLAAPIALHATLHASLMREARGVAVVAGIASVGWLMFQIERMRRRAA